MSLARSSNLLSLAFVSSLFLAVSSVRADSLLSEPSQDEPENDVAAARRRPPSLVACDPGNAGLTLPPGFCALVAAENVGRARHLVVRKNGDLYVAVNPAPDGTDPGRLLALRDDDGDGRFETVTPIVEGGGNGVALDGSGRFLYLARPDSILRFRLEKKEFLPTGDPVTIVSGLPADGDHRAKTVVLDGSRLFVNIGSASNACQVENREPFSPGVDPCPELLVRAGIWRFSAHEENQSPEDGLRYATGLRNTNALARNPRTGALWGVPNGRDQLFENWPDRYTAEDDRKAPAEEVVRIRRGLDNGWPYCYEDARLGTGGEKVLAPEYGGDGETKGRCEEIANSPLDLPAHWAPLSILFYTGRQFPSAYRGDAFIATHGARFPGPAEGPGYNVVRVRFEGGRPVAREVFADNFTGGATDLPLGAAHRPVGLAQGPDGSLYVTSDHKAGTIFRIVYTGE